MNKLEKIKATNKKKYTERERVGEQDKNSQKASTLSWEGFLLTLTTIGFAFARMEIEVSPGSTMAFKIKKTELE